MRLSIVALTAFSITGLLITGCASHNTMSANQTKWQGKSIQSVISQKGRPDATVVQADGTTVYTFITKTMQTPTMRSDSNYTTMVAPGGASIGVATLPSPVMSTPITLICTTSFTANKDGMIISERHEGNNCGTTWR